MNSSRLMVVSALCETRFINSVMMLIFRFGHRNVHFFYIERFVICHIFELGGLKFLPGQLRYTFGCGYNIFQEQSVCICSYNCFEFGSAASEKKNFLLA